MIVLNYSLVNLSIVNYFLEYKIQSFIFSFQIKIRQVRVLVFLLFISWYSTAQVPVGEQELLSRLKPGVDLPEKLLSARSVVFYPYNMSLKELELIQKNFQRTGIDAVVYLENDLLAAGRDASVALAEYLNSREITNLIIFQKKDGYHVYASAYNNKANLF